MQLQALVLKMLESFFLMEKEKNWERKKHEARKKTKKDCIFHYVGVLISPGSWRALSHFFNRMWTLNDAKQRQEEDIQLHRKLFCFSLKKGCKVLPTSNSNDTEAETAAKWIKTPAIVHLSEGATSERGIQKLSTPSRYIDHHVPTHKHGHFTGIVLQETWQTWKN